MRFIAYGCSYTFGAELADDWLTGKHHNTVDKEKTKLGVTKFYQKYTKGWRNRTIDTNPEYIELSNKRSYAGEIARTIGATEYINRATSGNTNKAMFLDVAEDIQNGFIKKDDIIFVGLTSSDRYTWIHNGRTHHGLPGGGSWPSEEVRKAILGSWTDDDFAYETILSIRALRDLLKDYKFFYQTIHFPYARLPYKTDLTESILTELKDVDSNAVVPEYSMWDEITHNKNLPDPPAHGFAHPKVEVATEVGKKIGTVLRAKLGLDK